MFEEKLPRSSFGITAPFSHSRQPLFVGGLYLLPLELSATSTKEALNECIEMFASTLKETLLTVSSYFYVIYPAFLPPPSPRNATHIPQPDESLSLQAYVLEILTSLLSTYAMEIGNLMLDIQVLPVALRTVASEPFVSSSQRIALHRLFSQWKQVAHPSFVERRTRTGPVILFTALNDFLKSSSFSYSSGYYKLLSTLEGLAKTSGASRLLVNPSASKKGSFIHKNDADSVRHDNFEQFCRLNVVVLAGTFDHLHVGHKFLLSMAALVSLKKVCVAVVQDDGPLLSKKANKQILQPFSERGINVLLFLQRFLTLAGRSVAVELSPSLSRSNIAINLFTDYYVQSPEWIRVSIDAEDKTVEQQFLLWKNVSGFNIKTTNKSYDDEQEEHDFPITVELLELSDAVGPARDREDFEGLIVTEDTLRGAAAVNRVRKRCGFKPLKIIELPVVRVTDMDARPLCPSSRLSSHSSAFQKTNTAERDTHCEEDNTFLRQPDAEGSTFHPPENVAASAECISSTIIRQALHRFPSAFILTEFWDKITRILNLPKPFQAAWRARFFQHLITPWRTENSAALVLMTRLLWSFDELVSCDFVMLDIDRAWLSLVFWFLFSVTTDKSFKQKRLRQVSVYKFALSKLKVFLELFCHDIFLALFDTSSPSLASRWRTSSSLPPLPTALTQRFLDSQSLTPELCKCAARHNVGSPAADPLKTSKNATLDDAQWHRTICAVRQKSQRQSGWRRSVDYLDLYQNLWETSVFALKQLLPELSDRDLDDTTARSTSSELFALTTHECCVCCSYSPQCLATQHSSVVPFSCECPYHHPPSADNLHDNLAELDCYGKDFVSEWHLFLEGFLNFFRQQLVFTLASIKSNN